MPEKKKKSIEKRIVNITNSILDILTFIFFLIFFLIGLYAMYDSAKVYQNANDKSLLKYKPGTEQEETEELPEVEDMIAWITMDGTPIDYPIMQGIDNSEYLNKDPYGNYSLSGSIFLDSRNEKDFTDVYSLLYGHHMDHGYMFGALDSYTDQDFFNQNKTGTLTVGETVYNLKTFSVVETTATVQEIFAPNENTGTFDFIREHSLYLDEMPDKNTKIVGLSTCKYPGTTYRTVVFCTMEWDGKSAKPPKAKKKKKKEEKKQMTEAETVVHYAPVEVDQTNLEEMLDAVVGIEEKDRVDGNVVVTPANDVLSKDIENIVASN